MRAIRAVFIANGIAQGIFFPFVAVILSSRGFSPVEIGVITALSSAAFTIAVPAWGHLADVVLGRRSALVIAALAGAAVMVLAGSPIPALVVAVCFVAFSLFESGWGPLADALAVNAVADRGRDYARVRLLTSMGFAISSAGVGLLYDRTGYGPAFGLCAAFAVALAIAARLTPDLPRADLAQHAPGRARGGSMAVALQVQPRLRSVLVALFLVHIGIIAGFTYLPLRVVALGGNPFDVAMVSSAGAFAEIPAMLLVGSVAARIGLRGLVAGSALLYAACFVGWAVLDSPTLDHRDALRQRDRLRRPLGRRGPHHGGAPAAAAPGQPARASTRSPRSAPRRSWRTWSADRSTPAWAPGRSSAGRPCWRWRPPS